MESPFLLEDFGQKVDLTRRIREVLLNYPEGTTILKELIQNADDAGATRVSFCLDRRTHATGSLLSDSLAQWQGPALLVYNDAVFTEDDFLSISRIGGSSKHSQACKTGRFGVGFNSVYHLTDLPSFVSGKYVVLFDPQSAYLPNISVANPGKRIEYVSSSAISLYKDQFLPYCAFGCDMKSPFHGTLFRFPLRNADQAAKSQLSKQVYLEDDLSSMFSQLHDEGILSLLFLKCVLSIEMYVWEESATEPRKLFSCCIDSAGETVVRHRQALLRFSNSANYSDCKMADFSLDFLSETVIDDVSYKRTHRFFVVQMMAPASSRIGSFSTSAAKDYDLHLLPWGSVAACISDDSLKDDVLKLGRAFCFLPLPVKTGFCVHINGYFEVSSNRRGIWYGDDMDRSGKIRSVWNRLLLEDVVAPCFNKLLLCVQRLLGPTKNYYCLWPIGLFEEPWNLLVGHIYRSIRDSPVLYSKVEGGKWISPEEAFLYDSETSGSKELGDILVQLGMPTAPLPSDLFNMILNSITVNHQKVVTPDSVRQHLRNCDYLNIISKPGKHMLLEYCLEDLMDTDAGNHASDLPLLPLANGDFELISKYNEGITYFICNELEYVLLQQISDRLIDKSIPINLLCRLTAIANVSGANMAVFNVNEFVKLFPKFVPGEWKYKTRVLWDPSSNSSHPTSSWFLLFWRYLREQCEELSLFGDWPILPSQTGHLCRPSMQKKMLNVAKLSDIMQHILAKLGCKILNNNYCIEHPDLVSYVRDADGEGALDSIFDVSSNNSIGELLQCLEANERDVLRQFILNPSWFIGKKMGDSLIQNSKWLPIYRVYRGESSETFKHSDLINPRKYIPPFDSPECLFGDEFLYKMSNNEEELLRRYYGIEKMKKTQFYKLHVLNNIKNLKNDVRDSVMLSILQDLPQLCVEDESFKEILMTSAFVPTANGGLKTPTSLYDPRNEELCALLEHSDSFPSGKFCDSGILDMLQALGLKRTVSVEVVIESARHVERLMHENQEIANSKGKILLSYLEVNAFKWLPDPPADDQGTVNRIFLRAANAFKSRQFQSDLEKFWNDLRLISWCPVHVSPPHISLPWPTASSMVAPPKLVRLYSDMWLVSASMRILDGECSSSALSYQLGWSNPPGGSVVAAQLLELGKNNEIVSDPFLRQELALAMPRIYSNLMSLLGSDEIDIVRAVLEGCRWIWVGDGFATSNEVVLNGPLNLAPYIRVMPIDLAAFSDLFLELGIQECLRPSDYANILYRMAMKKGTVPLDSHEISSVVFIAHHLAEAHFQEDQAHLYLPDVSGRLYSAADLVYNDAPWLLDFEGSDNLFGSTKISLGAKQTIHKFVHGNISHDVAEKLGVRSFRRLLLAESSDSMNLSLSGAAEAFGQHEALTTRLRHILEMYADGPSVLFELVQNAEDAGASSVSFLLDKTNYGTSSLLSREMADWQGPALYCFNDSVFSSQDLYAISRIGQENKLEKPFAIGRFGLGFNCVYHFSDIPTFVSGENIVMFDPHACNLPGISASHPGLRIKFVGRKILEHFPDQFSPFLHFGCDLQHSFPGTLFRFALRNSSAASRSQIKKEICAPADVLSLFSSFSEVVSETLLFLRNVQTVSIFVKEGPDSAMQLLHHVGKECLVEPDARKNPFNDIFSFMYGSQQDKLSKDQFLNRLSKSITSDVPWRSQKLIMSETNPSGCRSHRWIVSESLGGFHSQLTSTSFDKKFFKFVPWACVATPINLVEIEKNSGARGESFAHSIPNTADILQVPLAFSPEKFNFEGRAFCFLPLPINTGLPVHVNAYFELSSNRRDIWFGDDMVGGGKMRSDWNMYLLEEVVAPAYGHLLETLALELGPSDIFCSYWPTKAVFEPWTSLIRSLYHYISNSDLRVLYTKTRGGRWIATKQAIFPDYTFHKAWELLDALSDASLPVAIVPKEIVDKFMDIIPSLNYLTPELLRTLLIRRKREFRDRDAMILILEYCLLDLKTPVISKSFYGLPLIPLSNDTFAKLEKRGSSEQIFVASGDGHILLKHSIPHQLLDARISDYLFQKLCVIAKCEDFNINLLTCPMLEKLLIRLLPVEWRYAKQVTWVPGNQYHPSMEWVRLLWSYLRSCCEDLSLFSNWPILPVENNYLVQLVENSKVIRDGGWSENMSSLLQRAGCLILRRDIPIEHAQLNQYVQSSTAMGVLNALLTVNSTVDDIENLFGDASDGALHELRSFILQSKWFSEDSMSSTHITIIKNIPMFEVYKSRKLVSLTGSPKLLKPISIHEDLVGEGFVRLDSEKERMILKTYLGISEPSRVVFYKDYVLSHMSQFIFQKGILLGILSDIRFLIEEDSSCVSLFSMIPFVQALDGAWKEPIRLYDPRVPELKTFLHSSSFFPSENFSDRQTLDTLVTLGLRQTLGFTGLLDSAKSVSMLYDSRDSEAIQISKRLLSCLNILTLKLPSDGGKLSTNNVEPTDTARPEGVEERSYVYGSEYLLSDVLNIDSVVNDIVDDRIGEDFWSDLRAISWCPVYTDPPIHGLPWLASAHRIAAPVRVRPKSQMWIVSCKFQLLDGECSEYLQQKLGWMDHPDMETLSAQLVGLSNSYNELKLHFNDKLQKQIPLIYSHLQNYIETDDLTLLKSSLADVPWVWIGDDFVVSEVLAFDSPVKFSPYMYVVPSELSHFQDLLLALGVRRSFDVFDYFRVLQRLQNDLKGGSLSTEQLSFVLHILETVADSYAEGSILESPSTLLIPDSTEVLRAAGDLVYNDAPWIETQFLAGKRCVHPLISYDLANRLGVQSLRSLPLVSKELTKELPCMDYSKISELLESHGNSEFLLFDLIELADCCKTNKLHLIFDKREHPRQSLLQHNLAEFQGPALVAILEGASLSGDEVASLQFLPPWKLRGDTLNYGLGLLSCFSISDLPSVLSDGFLYIFDPRGVAIAPPSSHSPAAKVFPLKGTKLTERFRDQFIPMLIGEDMQWPSSNSTVIRMPLSSKFKEDGTDLGSSRMTSIFNKFIEHSSKIMLFLKSILQVSLLTWEDDSPHPCIDYSVDFDPLSAISRNPFSKKKWKKFQLSSIFSSSSDAIKLLVVDLNLSVGGAKFVDRWLMVLSMGSGQTRNMALDRRYLAYNLMPVAGVAAHLSRNGHHVKNHLSNSIMSPLPLSSNINIPVTVVGSFLVRHNDGRYLFRYQHSDAKSEVQTDAGSHLIEAWNRELMSCVRDSYIKLILEMQRLQRDPLAHSVGLILRSYGSDVYNFWPRSGAIAFIKQSANGIDTTTMPLEADFECLIEQVIKPLYARLVDLPVWRMYSGNLTKASEGMFLSQPGGGVGDNLVPASVCAFVKEHYPVFSVPWELVAEIQAVGVAVKEIKPKMVRDLLRTTTPRIGDWSIDTYIDVLEYCLSDIQILDSSRVSDLSPSRDLSISDLGSPSKQEDSYSSGVSNPILPKHGMSSLDDSNNSGGDAIEMMTNLGKALFEFGRGVVEDIGMTGGSSHRNPVTGNSSHGFVSKEDQKFLDTASEVKGLPCPTANNSLIKLGFTEVWVGSKEELSLVTPLAGKFMHPEALERPVLENIFSNNSMKTFLRLQTFSLRLLASHMKFVFHENWVTHVNSNNAPWFSWEKTVSSGREAGPSPEWISLFWKIFSTTSEDISLYSDWPLIPAFLGRPILCRVRERHLIFIPPGCIFQSSSATSEVVVSEVNQLEFSSESRDMQSYLLSFRFIEQKYPSLLSLLNQCNIPIFDVNFIDCAAPSNCLPEDGKSLGQLVVAKLVAAKQAGYFPEISSFSASDRDELFSLFAADMISTGCCYGRVELEVLRDLPIYRTVLGTYTQLRDQDLCMISSNTFLKPSDDRCLSHFSNSSESSFLKALGVPELHDQQILVKFGLPGFESKSQLEREDILIYLYANWQDLHLDSSVLEVLKDTNFVKTADEQSENLCKPKDLFDPNDSLLTSVFSGVKEKFPGERFVSDGWLQILRRTGLRTSTETDVVLECAKRVEYLGNECMKPTEISDDLETNGMHSENGVTLEIWELAESLVKTIFSNFAVLYGNKFCNLLGNIACIPAENGFPIIDSQSHGNRVLCSYKDAILVKDWSLAWSCAPILLKQTVVPPDYALEPLQLRSPPPFSTVLKHLQIIGRNDGEDTLAHWPAVSGCRTIDEASLEVLRYLHKVWDTLSSSDISRLQQVAFLPAANFTRLVTASSLFARLTINLSPFAFELPSEYLPFVKILRDLGLQDSLSVVSAKNILSDLQKSCGYQRLNPNELRAVIEILHFLCEEPNSLAISNWESEAIVPDDGCRLVHAHSCVFIDLLGSQYVNHIDASRLRFVHPELPESVCVTLGVRKLSEVVIEELDDDEDLCPLECIGSVSLAVIKQRLNNQSFQAAVWRVLSSIARFCTGYSPPLLESVQESLESIAERLKFVRFLYTHFLLLPKSLNITLIAKKSGLPEWDDVSKHRALYFVDRFKSCVLIAEPTKYIAVTDVIAAAVSHILDSPVPLPIGSLFLCPEHTDTAVLDILKLYPHIRDFEFQDGSNLLGKEILPQDAIQVQFNPLRPLYKGEIVAWKSSDGERLKYGRVPENVRPSVGQALYRFMLETSPGMLVPLLSSNIYSFKNISHSSEFSSATMQEREHMIHDKSMLETSGGVRSSSLQRQPVQDLQHGRVSSAEFVQAVREMLFAAGINLDIEKQSLLQTALTLQEQLKESQAALLLEQEKSDMAIKEADTAKAAWSCRFLGVLFVVSKFQNL
ncbi:sacsin [Dorcoceras hygrometricum]|uniref:Sacsin n=1 Tax=Dorcoceras hygrometricum TaxID=472368 RepID=A0A2Z7D0U4_9LAMI|nr:sacsin [Dorcoceras hygrometricum]